MLTLGHSVCYTQVFTATKWSSTSLASWIRTCLWG